MPFDGLTMHGLTDEIKAIILDSKIDKIHQPENDELVLHLRKEKTNYSLLLSSDSNLPYFNLVDVKKKNPTTAPMFCMLLRKHLGGGKIINFEQFELERILIITISSKDELGDFSEKKIIFEIMGKHSNITLINDEEKIIDCVKRIPLGVNRYRQLFPGITYMYPPNEKIDPRTLVLDRFLLSIVGEEPVFKKIYMVYQGFSPILSKEICLKSNIDPNEISDNLSTEEKTTLFHETQSFLSQSLKGPFKPQTIYKAGLGLKDLTYFDLSPYKKGFEIEYQDNLIDMVNAYYGNKNTVNKLLQRSHHLRKSIQSKIDRSKKKMKHLKRDLQAAEKADDYKIKGELILAYIYKIEMGFKNITLENFYDDNKPLKIDLDYRRSPSDNAQIYFKKYTKFKTAQIKVKEQMVITLDEIRYLEQVLLMAEQASEEESIEAIKEELILTNYLRRKQRHGHKKVKKIKNPPHMYKTSDGFTVYVGKNNIQNDELTFKMSSKSDLWFHTKDIPGSHVILKCDGNVPSEEAILETAMIAAYHSKGQTSSQVPVDYMPIKQVKKPNGAKPGMVIFHTHQTVYVKPDEKLVQSLKITTTKS